MAAVTAMRPTIMAPNSALTALRIDGVHSGLLACAEDTLDVEQALDERVDVLAR